MKTSCSQPTFLISIRRFPHAIDTFLSLPGISDETKRKALWDNCARLYAMKDPVPAN